MPVTKGKNPKPEKRPFKRPEAEIDEKAFNALCKIQCTLEEISAVLGVDKKTLILWCKKEHGKTFSDLYKDRRAFGKMSLRRLQWKTAEEGNPTMQIWLGRNWLGQSEDGIIDQEDEQHIPTTVILEAYDASRTDASNDTAV